jgi:hypothetical protein
MAELFSSEYGQVVPGGIVVTTTPTTLATTNFQTPPFNTAKAVITANLVFNAGASTTTLAVAIRRNPAGENALVVSLNFSCTPGSAQTFAAIMADPISDGRSVQYALVVTQNGATANGSASLGTALKVDLLSG